MSKRKKIGLFCLFILVIGFLLPQKFVMPVAGATGNDYNSRSFWHYPWGRSVTHKGVDIFAASDTPVHSSTPGLVVYTGSISEGGNIVLVLGPKWRVHYYAHLEKINTSTFSWLNSGGLVGTVGTSGNAAGKPPHLHYSIVTPLPYVWRMDDDRQGWKKMFYLNPIEYL